MASWRAQFISIVAVLLMLTVTFGCTDKRRPPPRQQVYIQSLTPQTLISRAEVRFQDKDTEALQMQTKGGSLYLTGRPFGFSRWDITSNPESPRVIFSVADEVNNLGPRWVVDWYASGALAILGPYGLMSGVAGSSVIGFSETSLPREVNRYPPVDPNSDTTPRDFAFTYKAMVVHPSQNVVYGFRENDYLYTLNASGSGGLTLASRAAYSDGQDGVCCVAGATTFQGRMYVAFRQALWFFGLTNTAALTAPTIFGDLQASNVFATQNHLYVQHTPTYANQAGSQYAAGIYVFDAQGRNVAFLDLAPRVFAVSQNDQYLYSNNDGASVHIYQINWTSTGGSSGSSTGTSTGTTGFRGVAPGGTLRQDHGWSFTEH